MLGVTVLVTICDRVKDWRKDTVLMFQIADIYAWKSATSKSQQIRIRGGRGICKEKKKITGDLEERNSVFPIPERPQCTFCLWSLSSPSEAPSVLPTSEKLSQNPSPTVFQPVLEFALLP